MTDPVTTLPGERTAMTSSAVVRGRGGWCAGASRSSVSLLLTGDPVWSPEDETGTARALTSQLAPHR